MDRHNPNVDGQQARDDLIAKKTAAAVRFRWKLQLGLLVVVITCSVGFALTLNDFFFFVGFLPTFFLLGSFIVGVQQQHLSIAEYKSLPGALDAKGKHRCIVCDHHGIYRRTIYKTTTTLAACSKCEAPLWASDQA
jgi:hypothetical protein